MKQNQLKKISFNGFLKFNAIKMLAKNIPLGGKPQKETLKNSSTLTQSILLLNPAWLWCSNQIGHQAISILNQFLLELGVMLTCHVMYINAQIQGDGSGA